MVGVAIIGLAIILYLTKGRAQSIRQILRQYATEPTQAEITFVNYKNDNLQVETMM
jgi:hypothetical protein